MSSYYDGNTEREWPGSENEDQHNETALKLKYKIGKPLTFDQAEEICRIDDLCLHLTATVSGLLRRAEAAEEKCRDLERRLSNVNHSNE